jgi:hypothetical protein
MPLPKDGEYYVTTTLLGGYEISADGKTRLVDSNRRMIYCWPEERPLAIMNQQMGEWTERDEKRLQAILKALREASSQ